MRALLTVPVLAVLAAASPKSPRPSFQESKPREDLNRYQGPTSRPIIFAKKSFFDSDLAVQPSVLYRLVTLPAFATSSFGNRPQPASNRQPSNNDIRYEDNAIDVDRPANYFKGDSRLYSKKSFGNFGLSAAVGPKPINGYRRAHTLQGGYYRPWDTLEAFAYESAPRPTAYRPHEPFLFAKNQPHQSNDRRW